MAKYRSRLPQAQGGLFLTDGGIETSLIFHDGLDLPCFAAFHILRDEAGRTALRRYYTRYIEIARREGLGFILESPTWRASPDWGRKLDYSDEELDRANRDSIGLMQALRDEFETGRTPIVVSGCVGPRGDGYDPGQVMGPEEAAVYHGRQIRTFGEAGVDMVTAITMTNANEAIGVTHAARDAGLPVAISFTVETDGRLPTGQGLMDAIEEVDGATSRGPAYYMINCAHPTHFDGTLAVPDARVGRVRGIRANASRRSHQELNEAPDLDDGDPVELGRQYGDLLRRHPQINVLGGCCGTDHRHVEQISAACRVIA
ncbi:homocysteine S-methyltransferase family protein [Inquilinus limosus]|uniref:homocysteine S-methyltransferase family protein n=1 Tax=Inquilinus limosus TaxID=171674 RepID=UPI003F5CCED8